LAAKEENGGKTTWSYHHTQEGVQTDGIFYTSSQTHTHTHVPIHRHTTQHNTHQHQQPHTHTPRTRAHPPPTSYTTPHTCNKHKTVSKLKAHFTAIGSKIHTQVT